MNLCPCELEFLAHALTTTCLRPGGQAIRTPPDPVGAEQIPANMIGSFLDDPPEAAPMLIKKKPLVSAKQANNDPAGSTYLAS
jgi:hypothetical protein